MNSDKVQLVGIEIENEMCTICHTYVLDNKTSSIGNIYMWYTTRSFTGNTYMWTSVPDDGMSKDSEQK